MGVVTQKSHVMVQPTMIVMRERPESRTTCPATIVDKLNVGWLVKFFLEFDDDVVSCCAGFCSCSGHTFALAYTLSCALQGAMSV